MANCMKESLDVIRKYRNRPAALCSRTLTTLPWPCEHFASSTLSHQFCAVESFVPRCEELFASLHSKPAHLRRDPKIVLWEEEAGCLICLFRDFSFVSGVSW